MLLPMNAVALFLRLTSRPTMATAERARATIAAPKKPSPPPKALLQRHQVTRRDVEGFPCVTVTPHQVRTDAPVAVYLHGGAYISGMSPQHWSLVGRLADAGVRVEVPDYGLAPQHDFRDAYRHITAVYDQLLAATDPARIAIAGDSAGAGLALGFAQTLLTTGRPQPRQLVLIAPWLDLTLTNPAVPGVERTDPWLTRVGLVEAGKAWAAGEDPRDARLSPIEGPLAGLAPLHVWIGTRDLFHPDVVRLRDLATAAGTPVEVTVGEGAVHVYPLTPTRDGRAAQAAVVAAVSR